MEKEYLEIKKSLKKLKIKEIISIVFLLSIGIGIFYIIFLSKDKTLSQIPTGGKIFGLFFAALFSGLGIYILISTIKNSFANKSGHPVLKALQDSGNQRVVWIYENNESRFSKQYLFNIVVGMSDGEKYIIVLPRKKSGFIVDYLKRKFPDASFGFNEEKLDLFNKNPDKLLKS